MLTDEQQRVIYGVAQHMDRESRDAWANGFMTIDKVLYFIAKLFAKVYHIFNDWAQLCVDCAVLVAPWQFDEVPAN